MRLFQRYLSVICFQTLFSYVHVCLDPVIRYLMGKTFIGRFHFHIVLEFFILQQFKKLYFHKLLVLFSCLSLDMKPLDLVSNFITKHITKNDYQ